MKLAWTIVSCGVHTYANVPGEWTGRYQYPTIDISDRRRGKTCIARRSYRIRGARHLWPWAQIWEKYHEEGMSRPDDDEDLFDFSD